MSREGEGVLPAGHAGGGFIFLKKLCPVLSGGAGCSGTLDGSSSMKTPLLLLTAALLTLAAPFTQAANSSITYAAQPGAGQGKHLVFVSGDEEYRSEEGLPMLAKILSQRHGFRCTVLFSLGEDGTIDPNNQKSLSQPEALDTADGIVMLARFRNWPEGTFRRFDAARKRGVPFVALRTSTHAFRVSEGAFKNYSQFGEEVLGEGWVSHWGKHAFEATRGMIEPGAEQESILRGVKDVFGPTDVYEAYPPRDARILLRGQVLKGINPNDPPAVHPKKRTTDKAEQDVNTPMMPVAWTRTVPNEAGKPNRVFCTTMGAATDLESADLRRLIVNAVYWGMELEVPSAADVSYVDPFYPLPYGFNKFRQGITPEDHALGRSLPQIPPKPTN